MFLGWINIFYVSCIALHYLDLIYIPDRLRITFGILFVLIHITAFLSKKHKIRQANKKSDDDDFFVFSKKPLNPFNPSSDSKKFMEDLNKYVKDKEKMKIRR